MKIEIRTRGPGLFRLSDVVIASFEGGPLSQARFTVDGGVVHVVSAEPTLDGQPASEVDVLLVRGDDVASSPRWQNVAGLVY